MAKDHAVKLVWQQKNEIKPIDMEDPKVWRRQIIFPYRNEPGEVLFQNPVPTLVNPGKISGRLLQGNNLKALQLLQNQGYEGKFDLIYIDPPYLSQNRYSSKIKLGENNFWKPLVFKDEGQENLDSYLNDLYIRLKLMKELLTERGSVFIHLDWHVSHYVKIILDEIFGYKNFINEIVWCYGGGSGSKRHFHRKHDLIFWYSRSDNYIFNPQYRPYSEGTMERGLTRVKGNRYKLHSEGALMQDWWTDINKILSPTAYENVKFPTQKPAALLERIVSTASYPDSLVADFYSGSGTTAVVCEKLNRKWVICDDTPLAITSTIQRLVKNNAQPLTFDVLNSAYNYQKDNNLEVQLDTQVQNKNYRRINVKISNYQSHKSITEDLRKISFISQIQFWEVDLDYSGDCFNSHIQFLRDKVKWDDSLPISATLLIPYKTSGSIAIQVHDIWGESCVKVLQY